MFPDLKRIFDRFATHLRNKFYENEHVYIIVEEKMAKVIENVVM